MTTTKEYYIQKKSKMTYGLETAYGSQVTTPAYFMGHLLSIDPKDAVEHIDVNSLDADTKDVEGKILTTKDFANTIKIRPIHGVPVGLFFGDDTSISSAASQNGTTGSFHNLMNLDAETFGKVPFTFEKSRVHSTPTSGHTVWYDGTVIQSFELSFSGGELIEISMDTISQDSGTSDDSGNSYESVDARGKFYDEDTKEPFGFDDVTVEMLGVNFKPTKGSFTATEELDTTRVCDSATGKLISEPVPTKRTYTFSLTGRMNADTYEEMFRSQNDLGTTTGLTLYVDGLGGSLTGTETSIQHDSTDIPNPSNIPSKGILKINNEYIFYDGYDTSTTNPTFQNCVRDMNNQSPTLTHTEGDTITLYGNINLQLERATDDHISFFMWGGKLSEYSQSLDTNGDIVTEDLTYTPTKVVAVAVDDIDEDYVDSSGTTTDV